MESPAAAKVGQEEEGSNSSSSSCSDEVKESALKKQKKLLTDDDEDIFDIEKGAAVLKEEEDEEDGMLMQVEDKKEGRGENHRQAEEKQQGEEEEEDVDNLYPYYSFYSDSDEEVMEQFRRYDQQVDESEGFDVDFDVVPKVFHFGGVRPLRLDICQQKKANLEFVDILKANFTPCAGSIYYITLRAHHRDSMEIKTFQAKVFHGWTNEGFCIQLMLFRPQKLKSNLTN